MEPTLLLRSAAHYVFLLCSVLAFSTVQAAEYRLRLSTENTRDHVQTQALERFADSVEQSSKQRIQVDFYHDARLFRDRDVISALIGGKVEMAVPGMWHLDRYIPDVGLYMLPLFYGREASEHHRIRDGVIGERVSTSIETLLGVEVPGRWLDLGHAHLYFTDSPVSKHEDLSGRKIRIPGGVANRGRLEAFGAEPTVIAWPDLPNALKQGRVSGVLTTHETVRSASLWEQGIRYGFEDMEYFAQYVPMVNGQFWNGLPPDLQRVVRDSWDAIVDEERRQAAESQVHAREEMLRRGIKLYQPEPDALVQWRERALQRQPEMVDTMGVSRELVELATEVIKTP